MSGNPVETENAANERRPLPKARRVLLVIILACAGFLNISSVQSAVIMLPEISDDLNIPTARQQWLTSAYNIAFGCSLLTLGRLADIHGRSLVFLCGMLVVTITATAIPFSPTESAIDALRALQGLGGAATVPSAVGILGSTFPSGKQKTYAFITYTAASSLGSVMGNVLGGVVGSFLTWKWVFWITALTAASIAIAGFWLIPPAQECAEEDRVEKPTIDWYGAGLVTVSFVLLLFALSEGNTVGWRTPWIIVLIVLSIALVFCFWFLQKHFERTDRSPLLRTSMFSDTQFTAAFFVIISFFASYNSYLVFATFFFQDYKGLTALQTAIRFLPSGVAGFLTCFVTAQFITVARGFHLLLFALTCGITSPLLFAAPIPPTTMYWAYAFPAMCLCISADILAPTINLFVVRQLPQRDQALGGALIQTSNQLGRALGLAISTAVEVAIVKGDYDRGSEVFLRGIRAGEWVNVGFAITALLIVVIYLRNLDRVGAKT